MGIYTNFSMNNSFGTSHYTEVEPFVGENFNYHELGIVAATEMAANNNAFMKAIALSELAAVEQTGSTDVLYESVDIKGIFEKIKMFFKKIIEKIHKIFHTFIAKMSSWFGGNAGFAKKYEKEVIKGWANVKQDWEFKGYDYSKALKTKKESADLKATATKDAGDKISKLLGGDLEAFVKSHGKIDDGAGTNTTKAEDMTADGNLAKYREKMDDIKQGIRKQIIDELSKDAPAIPSDFNIILDASGGLEQSEFTEELFKVFRGGEDSKQDLKKDAITSAYGGSVTAMMTFIKDFDTIKKNLEKSEKNITDGIDKLIKAMDKAENDLLKDNKAANEPVVQASSFYQNIWGAISEMVTQTFSALIQANKDACVQAKEIAVKVIGQGKKLTEESYDYSSNSDGLDFISSVKLI